MSRVALEKVNQLIAANQVMVFSKSYCPYCKRAKDALKQVRAHFQVVELDQVPDGQDMQDALLAKTKQRTVPNIFVEQKHLGGCDDLLAAIASNELQNIIDPSRKGRR
ncbi:Glutaredoxin [Dimargaris cristalligena]|nr:Glutaredoxin [Dimargaris cristalligena]